MNILVTGAKGYIARNLIRLLPQYNFTKVDHENVDLTDTKSVNNLFLNKICFIKGKISSPIKRIMMEFSFAKSKLIKEELTIEVDRHQYTKEYISLCKDFYLKM